MVKRLISDRFEPTDPKFLNILHTFNENFNEGRTCSASYEDALNAYVKHVADTGRTCLEWDLVRNCFEFKLRQVSNDLMALRRSIDGSNAEDAGENGESPVSSASDATKLRGAARVDQLVETLRVLEGAPFTVQRLAELLVDPTKHYKRADKFFRALEKNLLVVTTLTPEGRRPVDSCDDDNLAAIAREDDRLTAARSPSKRQRFDVESSDAYSDDAENSAAKRRYAVAHNGVDVGCKREEISDDGASSSHSEPFADINSLQQDSVDTSSIDIKSSDVSDVKINSAIETPMDCDNDIDTPNVVYRSTTVAIDIVSASTGASESHADSATEIVSDENSTRSNNTNEVPLDITEEPHSSTSEPDTVYCSMKPLDE